MTPVTVPFDATASHLKALRQEFLRDWIDSPQWVGRWLEESSQAESVGCMQSNIWAKASDRIARRLSEMSDAGSWPGIDYGHQSRENWDAIRHFTEGLEPLAIAYGSKASPLHHDANLRTGILNAIDFWLHNDFTNPNWWYQHIGLPGYHLGPALLMVRDHLTDAQRAKAAEMLSRCGLKKHDNWRTGGNCLFDCRAGLVYALFVDDAELVTRIFSRMLYKELHFTPMTGSGVKEDFSQWEHGNLLFNNGYGALIIVESARLFSYAKRAGIPVDEGVVAFVANYLLDGSQWMARGTFVDPAANGRGVAMPAVKKGSGTTATSSASYLGVGARYLLRAGAGRVLELEQVIRRASGDAPALSGNRVFYCSDFMVHQRPEFYLSVRGYSSRTLNTEVCNSSNRLGHHLGEGSMYVVRRGDEYEDVYPVWDWNKVPGTTTNLAAMDDAHTYVDENTDAGWFMSLDPEDEGFGRSKLRVSRIGRSAFAGGASNGKVGAACLDLKVLTLRARKSWTCLNDGVVCLGSGIATQRCPRPSSPQ